MKCPFNLLPPHVQPVAPYAGAWIEIADSGKEDEGKPVAPYAGAWIEIICAVLLYMEKKVAPYAGAWIEIYKRTNE